VLDLSPHGDDLVLELFNVLLQMSSHGHFPLLTVKIGFPSEYSIRIIYLKDTFILRMVKILPPL
ncbi:MAG: hypothetical protein ABR605_04005, partial [Desulfurivibrionaceae bacterium]